MPNTSSMKLIRTALAALLLGGSMLHADVIILKNGEKKEGTILEDKPDSVFMEYNVVPSGKIKDKKDFLKADIAQIIKQSPQEVEIVPLKKLLPSKDMMSADQYERLIQDQLRPFVNKYPGTPEAKEVEAMISTLQAEKEKVVNGQMKIEGEWLASDLVKRDDYNIQAYKLRRQMNEQAAGGDITDLTNALKTWDQLNDQATGYTGAIHYVKAIDEAVVILGKYESVITQMIAQQPILQSARDASVAKLIEPDKSRVTRAVESEKSAWKSQYDAEKKARTKWLPLYKYDIKTLQDALKLVLAEKGKLNTIDRTRLAQQNDAITAAMRYLSDENVQGAEEALNRAQAAGLKEYQKLISGLRSTMTKLKSDISKRKTSDRAFGSGSSAVGGSSGAITDDRVAEAMQKAKEGKKGGDAPAPDADAPPSPDAKDAKDEGTTEKPKAAKKAPRLDTTSDDTASLEAGEEEGAGGLQKILMYAAGGLILVLLIAFLAQKKKIA
jgi:hypothetical protein